MIDIFYPQKLENAKYEIIKVHSASGEINTDRINSNEFKALLKKISRLKGDELKAFAYSLSKKDLLMLAHYVPRNIYKANVKNITALICLSVSDETLNALFASWQNSYEMPHGEIIFTVINRYKGSREKFTEQCNIHPDKLSMAIKEGVTDIYLADTILEKGNRAFVKYSKALEDMKISKASLLGEQLCRLFYIGCSREGYLSLESQQLLDIVNKLNYDSSKKLLLNMLDLLEFNELKKYNGVLLYYMKTTGEEESKEFKSYFKDVEERLVRKYCAWINVYNMENIFGDDDRTKFWSQYADRCKTKSHKKTDSFTMVFSTFAIVEFKKLGPIYWFDIGYFNGEVYKRCENLVNEAKLRDWLYNYSDKLKRQVHYKDSWALEARKYTNKLLYDTTNNRNYTF